MELRGVTYILLFVSTACTNAPVPEPVAQSTAIVYDIHEPSQSANVNPLYCYRRPKMHSSCSKELRLLVIL